MPAASPSHRPLDFVHGARGSMGTAFHPRRGPESSPSSVTSASPFNFLQLETVGSGRLQVGGAFCPAGHPQDTFLPALPWGPRVVGVGLPRLVPRPRPACASLGHWPFCFWFKVTLMLGGVASCREAPEAVVPARSFWLSDSGSTFPTGPGPDRFPSFLPELAVVSTGSLSTMWMDRVHTSAFLCSRLCSLCVFPLHPGSPALSSPTSASPPRLGTPALSSYQCDGRNPFGPDVLWDRWF